MAVVAPSPEIVEHDGILVVRDDKMPGGTKARVLPVLFDHRQEYVYASPVYGYAQVALAHTAKAHGKTATVFCAGRRTKHPRTIEAEKAGARVVEVPVGYMSVVRSRARLYAQAAGARLLPFGLDDPAFIEALAAVARSLALKPAEVWTVAGSGVLSRALQLAWPQARFFAVQVGTVPEVGRATLLTAPEKFEQEAKQPPPFPSCSNYDAKAWRFIRKHASPGACFWNVAA